MLFGTQYVVRSGIPLESAPVSREGVHAVAVSPRSAPSTEVPGRARYGAVTHGVASTRITRGGGNCRNSAPVGRRRPCRQAARVGSEHLAGAGARRHAESGNVGGSGDVELVGGGFGSDSHVSVGADEKTGDVRGLEIGDRPCGRSARDVHSQPVVARTRPFEPSDVIRIGRGSFYLERSAWSGISNSHAAGEVVLSRGVGLVEPISGSRGAVDVSYIHSVSVGNGSVGVSYGEISAVGVRDRASGAVIARVRIGTEKAFRSRSGSRRHIEGVIVRTVGGI